MKDAIIFMECQNTRKRDRERFSKFLMHLKKDQAVIARILDAIKNTAFVNKEVKSAMIVAHATIARTLIVIMKNLRLKSLSF